MLGPVARSRVSLAAAVLLAVAAGGAVLAAESSPGAAAAVLSVPLPAPVHGPVVPPARAAVRPLLAAGALVAPARVPELAQVAAAPPSPVAAPQPEPVVGPGAPAEQVREVQRLLNDAGASLAVDGAWGPATERAVRQAQHRAGLPVDGRVGTATRAALVAVLRPAG